MPGLYFEMKVNVAKYRTAFFLHSRVAQPPSGPCGKICGRALADNKERPRVV